MRVDEARVRALLTGYRHLVRPVLFRLGGGDPEYAHEVTLKALASLPAAVRAGLPALLGRPHSPVTVAGIDFPGRVGFGAGLDKDGVAARAWAGLGFGHMELGTVTAVPQPGNPAPRLFRLVDSGALINRMGFNNAGAAALAARLRGWGVRRGNNALGIPVGVSIGKSKVTPLDDAVQDYLTSLTALAGLPDYFAINISSPNTPGLRELQGQERLGELVSAVVGGARGTPVFVKVAPDLDRAQLEQLVGTCVDASVSGFIATNTTLARDRLAPADQRHAGQAGGLSGAPLTARARAFVADLVGLTDLPVIGVGGIMTPADAQAMFDAGAVLVQVYTGFIYAGPALVCGINTLTTPPGGVR